MDEPTEIEEARTILDAAGFYRTCEGHNVSLTYQVREACESFKSAREMGDYDFERAETLRDAATAYVEMMSDHTLVVDSAGDYCHSCGETWPCASSETRDAAARALLPPVPVQKGGAVIVNRCENCGDEAPEGMALCVICVDTKPIVDPAPTQSGSTQP